MKINLYACLFLFLCFLNRGTAQTAEIGNFVWIDLDADGLQDLGEPGIAGMTITLTGTDVNGNQVLLTAQTDALGAYLFSNLVAGSYHVTFSSPGASWFLTAKDQGSNDALDSDAAPGTLETGNIQLAAGASELHLDAGFYAKASMTAFTWNDLDKNGIQNAGEAGLIDQTIQLSGTNGLGSPVILSLLSDANGKAIFSDLIPGTYKLTFAYPAGCQSASAKDQGTNDTIDSDVNPLTLATDNKPLISGEMNGISAAGFFEGTVLNLSGSQCGPGAISVTIQSSFHAPIHYEWVGASGGNGSGDVSQQSFSITGLVSDTYTVTTTDAFGCSDTAITSVVVTPGMNLTLTPTNVSCNGGANGNLNLTVTGGASPYTYNWTSGNTNQDPQNLSAGTYTVTVTDANGCAKTISASVTQPLGMSVTATVTNLLCNGTSNGSIDVSVTGGVPAYTYLWSNGATTQDLSNITAGTYTVTVTDANGCTKTANATINQPSDIAISNTTLPVACNGDNTGSINLTTIGGTPGYTYDWSNDGPEDPDNDAEDQANLLAGTYTVTVTDANGCSKTSSTTVTQPTSIAISAQVQHIPCSGATGTEGAIDITIFGGTTPYTYLWSNGATTQDLSNLPTGIYVLTATDAASCSRVATASVAIGNGTTLPDFIITNTSCSPGAADGSVVISSFPAGAQAPLGFNWQNPFGFSSTQQDISGLAAAPYFLTISDAVGCQFFSTAQVAQNASDLNLDLAVNNMLCNASCDGSIDLTVSNGTAPYTYHWSNNINIQDPGNLCAGTYTVTVTDAAGCSKTASTTLMQVPNLILSSTFTNVSCSGGNDGSINLTVSGGTSPYTYEWSNNATTQDLNNLMAGTYTVTVMDANGCTKVTNRTVSQSVLISLFGTVNNVTCFGGNNGSIAIQVSGGSAPYAYQWSTGATTQNINNLAPGFYCVTVTDAGGCTRSQCSPIAEPPQESFNIISLSNDCNSEILTGPVSPNFTYSWIGPNNFSSGNPVIMATISGVYTLTIFESGGCQMSGNYMVNLSGGPCGRIRGLVVHDENENCLADASESGLGGWLVRAEGADTLYGVTNLNGEYFIGVPTGTYTVNVLPLNGLWQVCNSGSPVNLAMANDTVFGGDFPVQSLYECPSLSVTMGTNQLRRCNSNNYYHVEYCNEGTTAAEDVYVLVTLDPYLTYLNASLPAIDLGNALYRFDIGDLAIGECGTFNIQVMVDCDAVLGQTHCSEAHIFPDTICTPTDPEWTGANLAIRSVCNSDSIHFIVKNTGSGNMNEVAGYIVIEDAVMFTAHPLPLLPAGDSIELAFPANGATWRLEVDQVAFHPNPTPPALSVEGCTTNTSFSTGYVNQFPQGNGQQNIDIDCTTNIGSYDPNDKYGFPLGYGTEHYIKPGTEIEYLIRFQNTGTDTAFRVEIIDTLSSWLDPASIHFGASSHRYRYDLSGEGIVHFIFENILLPDSNTNEVASHGFARFSIKPRPDAALETLIENTAAIYFDFNDPVFTNTTFHRLGENFISVGLWQPLIPDAQVIAVPNPFQDQTVLEIKGLLKNTGLRLQVFDLQGHLLREMESENGLFNLKKGDWPGAVYLFNITQNGRIVGSGKLMAD